MGQFSIQLLGVLRLSGDKRAQGRRRAPAVVRVRSGGAPARLHRWLPDPVQPDGVAAHNGACFLPAGAGVIHGQGREAAGAGGDRGQRSGGEEARERHGAGRERSSFSSGAQAAGASPHHSLLAALPTSRRGAAAAVAARPVPAAQARPLPLGPAHQRQRRLPPEVRRTPDASDPPRQLLTRRPPGAPQVAERFEEDAGEDGEEPGVFQKGCRHRDLREVERLGQRGRRRGQAAVRRRPGAGRAAWEGGVVQLRGSRPDRRLSARRRRGAGRSSAAFASERCAGLRGASASAAVDVRVVELVRRAVRAVGPVADGLVGGSSSQRTTGSAARGWSGDPSPSQRQGGTCLKVDPARGSRLPHD